MMHNHEALPVTLDSSPPPTKNERKKMKKDSKKLPAHLRCVQEIVVHSCITEDELYGCLATFFLGLGGHKMLKYGT